VPNAHDGARFLALRSRGGDVALAADAPYELVSESARAVVFERRTASGVRVTRTTTFDEKRFALTHEVVLKNDSPEKKSAVLDVVLTGVERAGERDEGGLMQPTPDALAGACKVADSRESFTSRDVEDEAEVFEGRVKYAAIDRHYFLSAVLFGDIQTERCAARPFTVEAQVEGETKKQYGFELVVEQAAIPLAPGEAKTLTYQAYTGPKQMGLLKEYGHELEENIDFGIFGVISRPMLWSLVYFHKHTGNFGIAVILLTLLMKVLTFPLTQKSYVGMQQMKKVAPQIKELQAKFGHDRALLGQKQMELYQAQGINPMAGCLPLLVQMPIWFALYRTLAQAVELYQQPFYFGIFDLTQPDMLLPFGLSFLPLVVGALMLWQTWLQPPPEDQPQMKYVLWGMPVMFTFLMLSMASGLSLYMITNSLLSMAQQYYIKRKYA
jgi:YidC/Oxa1 family membrane protein insertase